MIRSIYILISSTIKIWRNFWGGGQIMKACLYLSYRRGLFGYCAVLVQVIL
jgi:Na+/pantothenate symporter